MHPTLIPVTGHRATKTVTHRGKFLREHTSEKRTSNSAPPPSQNFPRVSARRLGLCCPPAPRSPAGRGRRRWFGTHAVALMPVVSAEARATPRRWHPQDPPAAAESAPARPLRRRPSPAVTLRLGRRSTERAGERPAEPSALGSAASSTRRPTTALGPTPRRPRRRPNQRLTPAGPPARRALEAAPGRPGGAGPAPHTRSLTRCGAAGPRQPSPNPSRTVRLHSHPRTRPKDRAGKGQKEDRDRRRAPTGPAGLPRQAAQPPPRG